jgi:beta-galactosidase
MPKSPTTLILLLAALLISPAVAEDATQPQDSPYAQFNFDLDWRFAKGIFPIATVDDTAWERISTPHTYSALDGYQGVANPKSDLGPQTYRKHFKIPLAYADRQVFLEFQGIRNRGSFILNGHDLGRHENGVTPFAFDITAAVQFGDRENVLQVETDCSVVESTSGVRQGWLGRELDPLSGGIVRHVVLHLTNQWCSDKNRLNRR